MDKLNWKNESEKLLSEQINLEYSAFYFYRICASYFDNNDIALCGLKKFFKKMAKEELDHAEGIIDFMNKRGLEITFHDIKPLATKFSSFEDVFEKSLYFERDVQKHILFVYGKADDEKDHSLTEFLDPYVREQVDSIKELNDYLVDARRCKGDLGTFLFDKQFLKNNKK